MATNYCIDTTVKVAFEFGYNLAVVKNGTTTFAEREITAEHLIQHYGKYLNDVLPKWLDLDEILRKRIKWIKKELLGNCCKSSG